MKEEMQITLEYLQEKIKAKSYADNNCLIWTGWTEGANEAPVIRVDGKRYRVRPMLFELTKGRPVKDNARLVMRCKNECCLRVSHMTEKSRSQIAKEAAKKRNPMLMKAAGIAQAKRQGWGKLSEDQRVEIWMDRDTPSKELAEKYGVGKEWINYIRSKSASDKALAQAASVFNPFYLLAA